MYTFINDNGDSLWGCDMPSMITTRALLSHRRLPHRGVLHLPALSVLGTLASGAGIIAGGALKKLALANVVKKVGMAKVIRDLRSLNDALHRTRPDLYKLETRDSAMAGLDALDRSLGQLREQEQVSRAWKWFEQLEKDNPNVAQVLLKTYLESFPSLKWASAILRPDPLPPRSDGATPGGGVDTSGASAEMLSPILPEAAERERQQVLRRLLEAVPELERYHIILLPKEKVDREAEHASHTGKVP